MKQTISFLLVVTMILLSSFNCLSAQNTSYIEFQDINQLRNHITKIFEDNYEELITIAKSLDTITEEDKYITYGQNCGPCTTAFQKILYDNSIVTEGNKSSISLDHIFNFMRTSFEGTPDIVSTIVIDTTYKQYVTNYYSTAGYDFDDIAQDLPPILIYEYGNYNQLVSELSNAKSRLGSDTFTQMCRNVFEAECEYDYLPQDFQQVDEKSKMKYAPTFIETLRKDSGSYNKKLNETLVINSTTQDFQKEFTYDENGVYRCYLSVDELNTLASGFNIVNNKSEILFGAKEENTTLRCIPSTPFQPMSYKEVELMSKGSTQEMLLYTYGVFFPTMISIDLRAGENTPAIYAYTVNRVLQFGDINSDGEVNITDITQLQLALANHDGYALDDYEKELANTFSDDSLNIFDATEISRYLAKYESEKCNQVAYFSATLELGCADSIGYIDMPIN